MIACCAIYLRKYLFLRNLSFPAVQQNYKSGVEYEDVILGNDALLKCKIPSFVADFVQVIGWQEVGSGEEFYADSQQSREGKN